MKVKIENWWLELKRFCRRAMRVAGDDKYVASTSKTA
jgi:hypothetical protein